MLQIKELRTLGNLAQNEISQCSDFKRRWYELVIDSVFTELVKPSKEKLKTFVDVPIYFNNKRLKFTDLNSILLDNSIIHHLPEILQENEIPSAFYNLSKTIQNKFINFQDTDNININSTDVFRIGEKSCECANSTYQRIITGGLQKIISKGPYCREPKTLNWKRCIRIKS